MISHENVVCNTGAFIKLTKVNKPTHRHSNIFNWLISLKPFQTIITQRLWVAFRLSSDYKKSCILFFFMYSFKDAINEHQR